jgi:opacity protein-like surface antigen
MEQVWQDLRYGLRTLAGNPGFAAGVVLSCMLCAGTPALAQSPGQASDLWEYEVTPYIWGCGLDGETAIGRLPAQGVEALFSDLVSVLQTAGMVNFTGQRETWGFLVDAFYVELTETTPTPEEVFGDAEVSMTQQMYTAAGTIRVSSGKAPVDIVVGARYNDLSADLELTSGIAQGRQRDAGDSWWDAVVGARFGWPFAGHWTLIGYGDVFAGGSEFSWQALAGVDWNFSKYFSGRFGYRYISFDYESDDLLYDMAMAGPYAGLGIRF